MQALDVPSKTNGKAIYGIDAGIDDEVEGMVYARPKIPPTRYGSKVVVDRRLGGKKIRGYLKSEALIDPSGTVPGWVMVYAESYAAASRAAELVQVKWRAGAAAHVSEQDILHYGARQIADPDPGRARGR